MARGLGDIGMFLPSETQYGPPGSYETLLRGEAQKRAAYLADIEAFYAELEETQRQFNETLEFKTETRNLELAFAEKELAQRADLQREGFAHERGMFSEEMEFKETSLDRQSAIQNRAITASQEPIHLGGDAALRQHNLLRAHQAFFNRSPATNPYKSKRESENRFLIYSGPNQTPTSKWS